MAEAEASKVDLFGRKIFFLNPAYSVRNEVITELQNEEYEVYIIESYRDAKNLLRLNENAILFINVDAQLAMNSWYNFIRTFEKEDVLSSIYIGIISERIRPADRELFLTTAQIPAGITMLDTDMKFITESILGVLRKQMQRDDGSMCAQIFPTTRKRPFSGTTEQKCTSLNFWT